MKRKKLLYVCTILLLCIILTTVLLLLNRNRSLESSTNSQVSEIKPVTKLVGSLNLMVDPRIELLSAVQLDGEYKLLTTLKFSYRDAMAEYFKPNSDHFAVKTFQKLNKSGFNYDAPPTSLLYVSNPPSLKQTLDFDNYLISRAGTNENLLDSIQSLSSFGLDSNFKQFYDQNLPLYEILVDTVSHNIKDMILTNALDDYYGMPVNSYNVILAPMLHSGGYGPKVKSENGLYDIYAILGPSNTIKSENGEILPEFSTDIIQYLIWHEFSHSFVNPTTDKYADEVNKYDVLYSYIRSQMEALAYSDWITCVNEHIVRAVTTRLSYIYLGDTAGDQAMASEKASGFYCVEALCDSLKTYEENRDVYPTFESYYPELIKVFQTLSEQDTNTLITFEGPINSAFNFINLDTVFILPTNEDNKIVQEQIAKNVKSIKTNFFPKASIIDDVDALEKDLGDNVVIAYGTMDGNLWLQEYKDTFPFQITSEKIVADTEYTDENLILISTLPNPQNSSHPLVVYTAKRPEDIIDINGIFHGPTDYIIGKDGEEIASGYYVKENDSWRFDD